MCSFIICGNGKVYEGRGWDYAPSSRLPYQNLRGNRMDIGHFGYYFGSKYQLTLL